METRPDAATSLFVFFFRWEALLLELKAAALVFAVQGTLMPPKRMLVFGATGFFFPLPRFRSWCTHS
jgi:hypothetical protein